MARIGVLRLRSVAFGDLTTLRMTRGRQDAPPASFRDLQSSVCLDVFYPAIITFLRLEHELARNNLRRSHHRQRARGIHCRHSRRPAWAEGGPNRERSLQIGK